MSTPETNQVPLETQVQIERVLLKPSLDVPSTDQDPKIKVVALEISKPELSSRDLFGQPYEFQNKDSSFAEIKTTDQVLKIKGGGDWQDRVDENKKKFEANLEQQKKGKSRFLCD